MEIHADKTEENKDNTAASEPRRIGKPTFQFANRHPDFLAQNNLVKNLDKSQQLKQLKAVQNVLQNSPKVHQLKAAQEKIRNFSSPLPQREERLGDGKPLQGKFSTHDSAQAPLPPAPESVSNGLPGDIKSGVESLSGISMDPVKVHYNSAKPAQLNAYAYTQGNQIYVGPGQQRHLPHEAWHVVQQAQGRVQPTLQMKGVALNNDDALEHEADVMGLKALSEGTATAALNNKVPAPNIIQRKITIGKNKTIPPFDDWEYFLEKVPAPFKKKATDNKAAIEALLGDGDTHPYDNFADFFKQFDVNAAAAPVEAQWPDIATYSCDAAAGRLKDIKICLPSDGDLEELKTLLGKNKAARLVVCKDHNIKDGALKSDFKELCSSIIRCDANANDFVAAWLSQRHGIGVGQNPEAILSWLGEDDYVVAQSPQMRGDMHDVLPAMALDPHLMVAVCLTNANRYADADVILGYYSTGFRGRVRICPFEGGNLKGPKVKKIGEATEVLVREVARNPIHAWQIISDETTGRPSEQDNIAYRTQCENLGFKEGTRYLIVNYRDSGHNPGKNREASHPELDSGVDGYFQMIQAAKALGFTAVPMGQPPQSDLLKTGPNLIEYWSYPCCAKSATRNKRQAEYGLLRYLAEHFDIRALSMRSGGTDAMVYAGIESISLDLASSGADKDELAKAGIGGKFNEGSNRSWMRAANRDLIMPGRFHQGFFDHPRPDNTKKSDPGWKGEFTKEDFTTIQKTIEFFFGRGDNPARGSFLLAQNNPLANPVAFSQRLPEGDRVNFMKYIEDMDKARAELYATLERNLPWENLRLRLEILRLRLEIIQLKLERIEQQLL